MSFETQKILIKDIHVVKTALNAREMNRRYRIVSKCPNCEVLNELFILRGTLKVGLRPECPNCKCTYEIV